MPVDRATIFQSGSVGKQFTAVLINLLVEDGKIALEDSVARYFPEAPQSWKSITVRHLLTHTSGIPNYESADFDLQRNYTESELIGRAVSLTLQFPAGARWSYSNTGYMLLGLLVKRVKPAVEKVLDDKLPETHVGAVFTEGRFLVGCCAARYNQVAGDLGALPILPRVVPLGERN